MFEKDKQGYYFVSERTNRKYDLMEMKTIGGERDYTSDIFVIVDFHRSSNEMHQPNFLGYLWGATNFNPNDDETIKFVTELVERYEKEMELLLIKAVRNDEKNAIHFSSFDEMRNYVNENVGKKFTTMEEMKDVLYEHWYCWGDNNFYYLPNDMCEYLFHIKANF